MPLWPNPEQIRAPANEFRFPREHHGEVGFQGDEKATIVHEATHAIQDVWLRQACSAAEDEAVALIAKWLYAKNSNHTFSRAVIEGSYNDLAQKIAEEILASPNYPLHTYQLQAAQMQRLEDVILAAKLVSRRRNCKYLMMACPNRTGRLR